MTSSSGMKSESRVEALQRMRAVSEAERRGSAAAVEGILTPMFRTPQDEERAAQIDANSEARLALIDEISANGPGDPIDVTGQVAAGGGEVGGERRSAPAKRGRKAKK
jgi:hypothetical protein